MRFLIKLLLLKIFRVKIIWTVHENIPHDVQNYRMAIFLEKILVNFADYLTFFSDYNRREFYRLVKNAKNKSILINAGPTPCIIPTGSYNDLRNAYDFPLNQTIILYFGNIVWYKGVQDFVQVYSKIEENSPKKLLLLLIGRCKIPELKSYLQNKLKRVKNWRSIEEYVPDDKLTKYLFMADINVMPFRLVSNSQTFLSAKIFPAKIVTPNMGSLPSQDHYGFPAFFFEPNNKKSLEKTLFNAIDAPENPKIMIPDDVVEWEWQKIYYKLLDVYRVALHIHEQ